MGLFFSISSLVFFLYLFQQFCFVCFSFRFTCKDSFMLNTNLLSKSITVASSRRWFSNSVRYIDHRRDTSSVIRLYSSKAGANGSKVGVQRGSNDVQGADVVFKSTGLPGKVISQGKNGWWVIDVFDNTKNQNEVD